MAMRRFVELEGEYVPIERVLDHIWDHPLADGRHVPLMVWGGKGTGKTQQLRQYARERKRLCVVYHPAHDVSGADIVGEALLDEATGKTTRAIPDFLPREGDPDGVLFVDEINRAPDLVLAGLMELFGEGTISQSGWSLPHNWLLVAAANPSELGYKVSELDEAMIDRVLHYAPGWDAPAWARWAADKGGFKPEVLDFALGNTDLMEIGEQSLPMEVDTKLGATPRSWEYFNALYEPGMTEGLLRVVSTGILGRSAADEFVLKHGGEERPLRFSDLYEGGYESKVARWASAGRSDLILATTRHMASGLIGLPVEDNMAQRMGKYLAIIPGSDREEAMSILVRSAPDWAGPLQDTCARWRQHLTQSGSLALPQRS
jgi:hypothetical protein